MNVTLRSFCPEWVKTLLYDFLVGIFMRSRTNGTALLGLEYKEGNYLHFVRKIDSLWPLLVNTSLLPFLSSFKYFVFICSSSLSNFSVPLLVFNIFFLLSKDSSQTFFLISAFYFLKIIHHSSQKSNFPFLINIFFFHSFYPYFYFNLKISYDIISLNIFLGSFLFLRFYSVSNNSIIFVSVFSCLFFWFYFPVVSFLLYSSSCSTLHSFPI